VNKTKLWLKRILECHWKGTDFDIKIICKLSRYISRNSCFRYTIHWCSTYVFH